jgi:hypothetical protein
MTRIPLRNCCSGGFLEGVLKIQFAGILQPFALAKSGQVKPADLARYLLNTPAYAS